MNNQMDLLKNKTRDEILGIRPGIYSDYDLLSLMEYFVDEQDRDREAAILELILLSPLEDEMVSYPDVLLNLIGYYKWKKDFATAIRWSLVYVVHTEQHEAYRGNILSAWRDLAEVYLEADELNIGLGILTRVIEYDPADIYNYNIMGIVLPIVGLNQLMLEVTERGLELLQNNDPDRLQEQFQNFIQEAKNNLNNGIDRTSEVAPETLQRLWAALNLPVGESQDDEAPIAYRSPIQELSHLLDEEIDEALEQEILAQGKILIPELIHLAQDDDLRNESAGPWHAARLLNQLRRSTAPELDALANWLDRTEGRDWSAWRNSKIAKIGGYTVPELEAIARDPSYDVAIREAALSDLADQTKEDEGLRDQVVKIFRNLLNRENVDKADEETLTGFLISDILDMKAHELIPDILKAFSEDRVDQHVVDINSVEAELGLPKTTLPMRREDGLYLWLKCKVCERTREHFTRYVIIDQTSIISEDPDKRSPYVLDHEIVCPKCGAVDQYSLESSDFFKLIETDFEQLATLLSGERPTSPPKYKPNVFAMIGEAFGRRMHPLDVIETYRHRIALQPNNGELWMRLGNTLRLIGRYPQSLEAYRKAVELAPQDSEVLISAATAEHDYGDLDAAKRLYEQCLQIKPKGANLLEEGINEDLVTAAQGLQALKTGEMSPWSYELKNQSGRRLEPPGRQFSGKSEKKDKRRARHGKKRH